MRKPHLFVTATMALCLAPASSRAGGGDPHVLWIDKLAADCNAALGTKALPYCTITEAIEDRIEPDVGAAWTLNIRANSYVEPPLVLPDAANVTIAGWDGRPKLRSVGNFGATLTVGPGSIVHVRDMQFVLNDSNAGVICGGATMTFDYVLFHNNKLQGYNSTDCTTTFDRAVVYDNDGGGVASYGTGSTTLISSFVSGNGTQNFGDFGGIRSAQGNELHLIYSSVINNISMTGPSSLDCDQDAGPAEIRNSVIIGFQLPSVACPTGNFSYSVLDQGAALGSTNFLTNFGGIAKYFDPGVQGVFAVKSNAAISGVARWTLGDPTMDYEGDIRPSVEGAADWPGADAYPFRILVDGFEMP